MILKENLHEMKFYEISNSCFKVATSELVIVTILKELRFLYMYL